jgi:hypothetical protein
MNLILLISQIINRLTTEIIIINYLKTVYHLRKFKNPLLMVVFIYKQLSFFIIDFENDSCSKQ